MAHEHGEFSIFDTLFIVGKDSGGVRMGDHQAIYEIVWSKRSIDSTCMVVVGAIYQQEARVHAFTRSASRKYHAVPPIGNKIELGTFLSTSS